MVQLNEEKDITFLFSTHDPLVMDYARRLVRLDSGKIVEDDRRG
jgi:putative ABC transport system ATP-binding protein